MVEVIVRGLNIVYKKHPYLPPTSSFSPLDSTSVQDAILLKYLNVTCVRLGCLWTGLYPLNPNTANLEYLHHLRSIVETLASHSIYSLVEWHQDLLGSRFNGHGVPDWLFASNKSLDRWFPFPVGRLTSLNDDEKHFYTGKPLPKTKLATWYLLYFSLSLNMAFDWLYTNKHNERDLFQLFWNTITLYFMNDNNQLYFDYKYGKRWDPIIAFGIINEPWAGNIYKNPLLLIKQGHSSKTVIHRFQTIIADSIREIDSNRAIMFEGCTWDLHYGANTVPSTQINQDIIHKSFYSFHYYRPPQRCSIKTFLKRKLQDSIKLGNCPLFMTEWEMWTGDLTEKKNIVSELDNQKTIMKKDNKMIEMWNVVKQSDGTTLLNDDKINQFINLLKDISIITIIEDNKIENEIEDLGLILKHTVPINWCGWAYKSFAQGENSSDACLFAKYPNDKDINKNGIKVKQYYNTIIQDKENYNYNEIDHKYGIKLSMIQLLSRYYPHIIPGNLLNYSFNENLIKLNVNFILYNDKKTINSMINSSYNNKLSCNCKDNNKYHTDENCEYLKTLNIKLNWTPWSFKLTNNCNDERYIDRFANIYNCKLLPIYKESGLPIIPKENLIIDQYLKVIITIYYIPEILIDLNYNQSILSLKKETINSLKYYKLEENEFKHKINQLNNEFELENINSNFIEKIVFPEIESDSLLIIFQNKNQINEHLNLIHNQFNINQPDNKFKVISNIIIQLSL